MVNLVRRSETVSTIKRGFPTQAQLGILFSRLGLRLWRPVQHHPASPTTHTPRRLLPKSRLASADEPPAEEADEAANYYNDGDGDPRDRAGREGALVCVRGYTLAFL